MSYKPMLKMAFRVEHSLNRYEAYRALSRGCSARVGSSGAERLSIIIIQKRPPSRCKRAEIRLVRRWAILSLDSSALQPD